MFDFHKLEVYKKIREVNTDLEPVLKKIKDFDRRSQLTRASLSVQLNLAEGTGRFSRNEKRRFYIISRASLYECVALFDYLLDLSTITQPEYNFFYVRFEEISKMLYAMIVKLDK